MKRIQTELDFDSLSWHDCHIWRIELRAGDPKENDWTSDLVLGLDYIVQWHCDPGSAAKFAIAPAELVFHGVTDLRIAIDWGDSSHQWSLNCASINGITRIPIKDQKVYLDRPYYSWTIRLNWPDGGEITFGAVGFTQTLLGEPLVSDQQCLSLSKRREALK